ncbi:unnamed protein product [Euphydryas editha]|uniref:Uncharacterized protein n=1 Tax=Euphydryas editha TaxID=104508 RepID=A0AAU9UVY9_EUPED|nr:unnamed protein product [Euphydryas editha]
MSRPVEPILPEATYQPTDTSVDEVPPKRPRPPNVFSFFNLFTINLDFFADPSGKLGINLSNLVREWSHYSQTILR